MRELSYVALDYEKLCFANNVYRLVFEVVKENLNENMQIFQLAL